MAFTVIEEEIIRTLKDDSNIKIFLVTDVQKKIFAEDVRPQTVGFPNISTSVDYGPQTPALPAMLGTATIMMEFEELDSDGIPTKYSDLSLLKQHILDALSKVDFGSGANGEYDFEFSDEYVAQISGLILNHFLLIGNSEPIYVAEDKVWKWPLIFEFVHEDEITVDRVGVNREFTTEFTTELNA